jgi:hypothetical protein
MNGSRVVVVMACCSFVVDEVSGRSVGTHVGTWPKNTKPW